MEHERTFYPKSNEMIRIECMESLHARNKISVMSFFRQIGLPHVYWEVIVPSLEEGNALTCLAIRDRPWPPWGSDAQEVRALIQGSFDETRGSVSNVFVLDDDTSNIGLLGAVYKQMLQELEKRKVNEIDYAVLEGSEFARRVLVARGFAKTDDILLTEMARYNVYQAQIETVTRQLGLESTSVSDLLSNRFDEALFEKNALFHAMTYIATKPFWYNNSKRSEILVRVGGRTFEPEPSNIPPS